MNSKAVIPSLLTRSDVASLLEIQLKTLTWWVWALDEQRRYTEFDIRRRNGDLRRICAPIKPIKEVQQRLGRLLLDWYVPPPHVHGFVLARDPRSNARPHRRQQWVLKTDLADFFPSINFGRVRGLFMAFPFDFPEAVATLLAQICCHRNQLPQGAPTSPVLSNFICRGMDRDLAALARAERCYFTRYADDLTFSTDRTVFPGAMAFIEGSQGFVGSGLEAVINNAGFKVNGRKTRLVRRWQRQRVTGLVVNRQLNVPRDYVRSLRNLLYVWKRYGIADAEKAFLRTASQPNAPRDKVAAPFADVVRGRVQYVGSVKGWEDDVYVSLARSLAELHPNFERRATVPQKGGLYVYTEGKTDVTHLARALAHFQDRDELLDLVLEFDDDSAFEGDGALQKHLRRLPATKPSVATVCLFDRDNEKLLREEGLLQDDWVDRGNGVVAAALVVPPFRATAGRLCIEMLYLDDDLRITDADGRRIYLRSEFDERSGHHRTEDCSVANPRNDTLVREDVHQFGTQRSIALSKAAFAEVVEEGRAPFDAVSFDGFRATFEVLRQAALAVAHKVC